MLNLTGLDDLRNESSEEKGEPLQLPLDKVIEDPDQPRKRFDEAALEALAESIKVRGVKSPISVKPANADGFYVINHGARRYRASLLCGKLSIPGFIDATHDSYDQMIENIHRDSLTPMEIGLFIRQRVTAGERKGDIAANLGQKNSYISEHLALVDAPASIQALAREAKVGAKTLYVLAKLSTEFPEEVDAYLSDGLDLSRAAVTDHFNQLRASRTPGASVGGAAEVESGQGLVGVSGAGEGGGVAKRVPGQPRAGDSSTKSSAYAKASETLRGIMSSFDKLKVLSQDEVLSAHLKTADIDKLSRGLEKVWAGLRLGQDEE
ncbi:MAG: ParB/RepB/Spo0J family partition protein [Denitromonas halophila]|nr:MAG: ParB/RepB/Spo0J family partition protein [Denitromonas halophila]